MFSSTYISLTCFERHKHFEPDEISWPAISVFDWLHRSPQNRKGLIFCKHCKDVNTRSKQRYVTAAVATPGNSLIWPPGVCATEKSLVFGVPSQILNWVGSICYFPICRLEQGVFLDQKPWTGRGVYFGGVHVWLGLGSTAPPTLPLRSPPPPAPSLYHITHRYSWAVVAVPHNADKRFSHVFTGVSNSDEQF